MLMERMITGSHFDIVVLAECVKTNRALVIVKLHHLLVHPAFIISTHDWSPSFAIKLLSPNLGPNGIDYFIPFLTQLDLSTLNLILNINIPKLDDSSIYYRWLWLLINTPDEVHRAHNTYNGDTHTNADYYHRWVNLCLLILAHLRELITKKIETRVIN